MSVYQTGRDYWADERNVERLKALLDDGKSAAQIVAAMPGRLSRSAVIAKITRLGLRRNPQHTPGARPPRVRKRRPTAPKRKPINNLIAFNMARKAEKAEAWSATPRPPKVIAAPAIPDTAKPWLERGQNECAFPVGGEGAETRSCCARTNGRHYCDHHWSIAHTAPMPRRERAR